MSNRSKSFHLRFEICDRSFLSHNQRAQHLGGLAHKKKVKQAEEVDNNFHCKTPNCSLIREYDLENQKKERKHRSVLRRESNNSK